MSYVINNNALEVDPSPRNKRKRSLQCSNVYMNPALDLLSTEDTICNTAMEIKPAKRTRRSRSCEHVSSFDNSALDTGIKRREIYGLLRKELTNVSEKLPPILEVNSPMLRNSYQNLNIYNDASMEEKSILKKPSRMLTHVNSTPVNQSRISIKQNTSFDLSFIEKLGIDDDVNGEALYLDDDLNESNIMEIKTITVVSKKPKENTAPVSTNPFLNCVIDYDVIEVAPNEIADAIEGNVVKPCNNFPFDLPLNNTQPEIQFNESTNTVSSYEANSIDPEEESVSLQNENVVPRRLFNETMNSTCNDQAPKVEIRRVEQVITEREIDCNFSSKSATNKDVFVFGNETLNKQSKILGCDVSQISKNEIFNGAKPKGNEVFVFKSNRDAPSVECNNQTKNKNKTGGKISSKLFGKIKEVFKHDKKEQKMECVNGNPYEVVRKQIVQEKTKVVEPVCFENPALNLKSIADEEFEDEMDDGECSSFQKRNPFEITPMKRSRNLIADKENYSHIGSINDCIDLSDICCQSNALGKKQVRFDSTLNHEKIVTGNSFDSNTSSTCGRSYTNHVATVESFTEIDSELDNYHNELENCYNEKKFIRQNIES